VDGKGRVDGFYTVKGELFLLSRGCREKRGGHALKKGQKGATCHVARISSSKMEQKRGGAIRKGVGRMMI
jgi:hypothetical protein